MTNEEMKRALANGGMTTADIEKVSDRFDAEKLTEMVEAANTPEEAFKAIHAAYPELAVSELEKQCDFMREQFDATLKEQKKGETVELSEDELDNVSGGGFFGDVGNWFKKNWKKVAVGAAIAVGAALVVTGVGCVVAGGIMAFAAPVVGGAGVGATAANLFAGGAIAGIAGTMLGGYGVNKAREG